MESNLELLTKAYIEYANVGPLMNTLKTAFKRSSTKVFEKCKTQGSTWQRFNFYLFLFQLISY